MYYTVYTVYKVYKEKKIIYNSFKILDILFYFLKYIDNMCIKNRLCNVPSILYFSVFRKVYISKNSYIDLIIKKR